MFFGNEDELGERRRERGREGLAKFWQSDLRQDGRNLEIGAIVLSVLLVQRQFRTMLYKESVRFVTESGSLGWEIINCN